MAKELEPFRLLWLEEPVPAENVDAMRDIRQSTTTPICCGENLFLRHGFREVLEKRASATKPDRGIVRLRQIGRKQDGTVVVELERTVMFLKREK